MGKMLRNNLTQQTANLLGGQSALKGIGNQKEFHGQNLHDYFHSLYHIDCLSVITNSAFPKT
jgi:hypothetical protein